MQICNIVKLETARDELQALATLLEHDLPQDLLIDVIIKASVLIDEVIDAGVQENSKPKEEENSVGISDVLDRYENLVKFLKNMLED